MPPIKIYTVIKTGVDTKWYARESADFRAELRNLNDPAFTYTVVEEEVQEIKTCPCCGMSTLENIDGN